MPDYQPLTPQIFTGQCWRRCEDYHFAARDAVAPLVAQEIPRACVCGPVGFVAQGEGFTPVLVQGLESGKNLLVAPNGRWLLAYVPAVYRAYPFALAPTAQGGLALCMDMDSGLLLEPDAATTGAEAFFDEAGEPSAAVAELQGLLTTMEENRERTVALCRLLAELELIEPWPISVTTDVGEHSVAGLCRISEERLMALPPDAVCKLHQTGAMAMAYSQLLSMQNLKKIAQFASAHAQVLAPELPVTADGDLDLDFLEDDQLRF